MKKLRYLLLLFAVAVNAQNDEIFDKMAVEICSCLDSKKLDLNSNTEDDKLMMTVGLCMLDGYSKYKMELPEKDRAEFDDSDGLKALGEKVAIKMVAHCPDYIIALGKQSEEESSSEVKEIKIEGKVSSIETKQFVTIKLKDKNSRNHNFLLLDYFDTASVYTEGKIKAGTELTVGYTEVEMYDPEAKDFKYFKVITSLQIK